MNVLENFENENIENTINEEFCHPVKSCVLLSGPVFLPILCTEMKLYV